MLNAVLCLLAMHACASICYAQRCASELHDVQEPLPLPHTQSRLLGSCEVVTLS